MKRVSEWNLLLGAKWSKENHRKLYYYVGCFAVTHIIHPFNLFYPLSHIISQRVILWRDNRIFQMEEMETKSEGRTSWLMEDTFLKWIEGDDKSEDIEYITLSSSLSSQWERWEKRWQDTPT